MRNHHIISGLTLAATLAACEENGRATAPTEAGGATATPGAASFTAAYLSKSTLLGRATFAEGFKVKRKDDDFSVDIKASPMDIAVQSIVFQAGGNSGWHSHPGPVLIQVVSGTMTFYESDDPSCTPEVRTAGQAFLDVGDHAHIARNETDAPATNVVTYFAPVGAPLRNDAPNPGNCPF